MLLVPVPRCSYLRRYICPCQTVDVRAQNPMCALVRVLYSWSSPNTRRLGIEMFQCWKRFSQIIFEIKFLLLFKPISQLWPCSRMIS
jgi:hypothetical protein